MEIKYSENTVETINELFSNTKHWGDMRSYEAMITPVIDGTMCTIVSLGGGILFFIGMVNVVNWAEHISLGIFMIFLTMIVTGVFATAYLWIVDEYTESNPRYKQYRQWKHFTELVDEVREACITQEFLKRSNVKKIRCIGDKCEFEVGEKTEGAVRVYTEYSIPKSIREDLLESGVLDFTSIDCIVDGLKGIQQGLR